MRNRTAPEQTGFPPLTDVRIDERLSSEDHCFYIIKPDARDLCLEREVDRRIAQQGLSIVALRTALLTPDDVQTIWTIANPHVSRTIPYMTSCDVVLGITEGSECSERMLKVKRSLRRDYPNPNPVITVIHTTDHDAELNRTVEHFFPGFTTETPQ